MALKNEYLKRVYEKILARDPNEKEFGFGDIMAHPKAFNSMLNELNKCVLVCSNCHKEIHVGIRECPPLVPFNLGLINQTEDDVYDTCPVCGKKKKTHHKTCSHECAARMRIKVNWDEVNLVNELKTKSASELADELGVTPTAVYKRMKKVGLK